MRKWLVAAVIALSGWTGSQASANNGYPGCFGFWPYGFQSQSSVPSPPYFALHPPVYYGERYARPYGISPFAAIPNDPVPASYHGRSMGVGSVNVNPTCDVAPIEVMPTNVQHAETTAALSPVRHNPYTDGPQVALK
jgi:hypothetical protein